MTLYARGQRQSFDDVRVTSALPPKADMVRTIAMAALCHKETFVGDERCKVAVVHDDRCDVFGHPMRTAAWAVLLKPRLGKSRCLLYPQGQLDVRFVPQADIPRRS